MVNHIDNQRVKEKMYVLKKSYEKCEHEWEQGSTHNHRTEQYCVHCGYNTESSLYSIRSVYQDYDLNKPYDERFEKEVDFYLSKIYD